MLQFLNVFFFVFHTLWMLLVALGWAWRRTRPYHLAALALTGVSWFVLGYWYGWGFCVCTEWHARVRRALGYPPIGGAYTRFLIQTVLGIRLSDAQTDTVTGATFFAALLLDLLLIWRDARRRKALRTAAR